jgi:O-antigen ligase
VRARAASSTVATLYTPLSGEARWYGDWEFSELGADPSQEGAERVTIPFSGTGFGLRVRRGDYRGAFYVTIDGEPADHLPQDDRGAYLILTSPDRMPQVATISVAQGLDDGPHIAEVVVDRAWDQWPLAGWQVSRAPAGTPSGRAVAWWGFATGSSLILLLGVILWRLARSLARRRDAVETPARASNHTCAVETTLPSSPAIWFVAMVTSAALFYFSPFAPLTVLGGIALAALVVARLDLGLALVAGVAPFYLKPRPIGSMAFSMAEIMVLLCAASWGLRRIAGWYHARREGRAGAWEVLLPVQNDLLGPRTWLDGGVLFLTVTAVASCFVADYRHVALRELRVLILEPAMFYLMVRSTRLDRRSVWRMVDLFVAGAVAVALVGLVQYASGINVITAEGGLRRLRSVYGSPNNVGLYLGRALPVLAAVAMLEGRRRRRLAYGMAALPVLAAIVLSFSRGALLIGVPVSLIALGILAGGRWLVGALAVGAAALVAAIPLARTPRIAALFDTRTGTTFFRLHLWQSAWDMFRDHPWLGVGPDNFLYSFRGRYIRPAAWQEPNLSQAHNIVLDYATRLGIPGLVAGAWLQLAFWRLILPLRHSADPERRVLALGLMGSMINFLAHGLVDASFFPVDLAFVLFLTLGLVQSVAGSESHGH